MLKRKLFIAVLAAVMSVSGAFAAPWFSHNSRRNVHTLIVVGNYKIPRMMADIILNITRQHYLLINNDNRYFIVMPKLTREIPAGKLDVYINKLNPRRLFILGDDRYVSSETEKRLHTINLRRIPIARIYGENWVRIAEELDDLLNIGNLSREFTNNFRDLQLSDRPLRNQPRAPMTTEAAAETAAPAAAAEDAEEPAAVPVDPEAEAAPAAKTAEAK